MSPIMTHYHDGCLAVNLRRSIKFEHNNCLHNGSYKGFWFLLFTDRLMFLFRLPTLHTTDSSDHRPFRPRILQTTDLQDVDFRPRILQTTDSSHHRPFRTRILQTTDPSGYGFQTTDSSDHGFFTPPTLQTTDPSDHGFFAPPTVQTTVSSNHIRSF
jgi:hypothetical protein